jgi:50S ribosomal protein L16 3-hydroxylase
MTSPAFRDFDPDGFLREHWQKAPLLIRNPWVTWQNPLSPEELAGLACEPEVESRLVRTTARHAWELVHGPLSPRHFDALGEREWTLLVQAVDHHVPDVAALLEPFRFIPNWRIDDVMVSYAVDGGGVGPHFDQYDVFLVQGLGRRRWRVGARCDESTSLLPHDGLRLLADFEPLHEWVLEPGDILYLPPGFAHDGIAVGDDCMTYSIGFRAPSRADLLSGWTDSLLDTLAEDDRFTDAGLQPAQNPGEIAPDALETLQAMVADAIADRNGFARWFGAHVTAPKSDLIDWTTDEPWAAGSVRKALAEKATMVRNPASRFAFVRTGPGSLALFVDGVSHDCTGPSAAFAERLCASTSIMLEPGWASSTDLVGLVGTLVSAGSVAVPGKD